ncbi:MAG: transcription antitermination factor NusB [Gammaproteobacteria bacterium]|nr:MAG: transcription antitermination factor NusB [Gammaproteobacteria bacterium]
MAHPARRGGHPHARRSKARRLAMQALYQWQMNAAAPSEIIAQFEADDTVFRGVDRDYFERLVTEIIGRVDAIDALYAPDLDRPVEALDPVSRAILRLAAHELADHLEVPFRVVIDEAVTLARRFGPEKSHAYVNAVLDRLSRRLRAVEHGAG